MQHSPQQVLHQASKRRHPLLLRPSLWPSGLLRELGPVKHAAAPSIRLVRFDRWQEGLYNVVLCQGGYRVSMLCALGQGTAVISACRGSSTSPHAHEDIPGAGR